MDAKKLQEYVERAQQFDVSDIDVDAIKDFLFEKRELVVCIVFILLGVWGGFFLFNKNVSETKRLQKDVEMYREKTMPSQAYNKQKKALKKFYADFPKKLADQRIITELTNLAIKHNIVISSFSPAIKVNHSFFQGVNVKFDGTVPDYFTLVKFVHDIESSEYALRIDSLVINQSESSSFGIQGERARNKVFNISAGISAVSLVENEKKKVKK